VCVKEQCNLYNEISDQERSKYLFLPPSPLSLFLLFQTPKGPEHVGGVVVMMKIQDTFNKSPITM
jgi:hypothetical protein